MSPGSASVLAVAAAVGIAVPGRPPPAAGRPTASSASTAIAVVVPAARGATGPQSPTAGGSTSVVSFAYPRDGSVVISGPAQASSSRTPAPSATATATSLASASVSNLSIFDGEITADSVSDRAEASSAGGVTAAGSAAVTNLQALGRGVEGGRIELGGWGYMVVGERESDRAAPHGVSADRESVVGLLVVLTRPHGGLPAGSRIEIAVAQASASTAPPPAPSAPVQVSLVPADRPQLLPPPSGPLVGVPQEIEPPLGAGVYVFPVYGAARTSDDFGTLAPDVDYEHGVDIYGQLGEPLVAVSTGTLFAVGWTPLAGNRLWLRDDHGNEFSYSHLSAFASVATNGAHVSAGEVIGFMGDTGVTQGEATHVEFEVHPVSLLYLGPQGAVDPTPYLAAWRHVTSVSLTAGPGWAPSVRAGSPAPEPGAFLVSSSDIASTGAVGPSGLRRALGRLADG